VDINRSYYSKESPGRLDYWRKMAAPRFRMATFLKILDSNEFSSVVDLGCGSGEVLYEIQKNVPGIHLCGIDLSSEQIQSNQNRDTSIEWHSMDLDKPFSSPPKIEKRYDFVLASEIIEHVQNPLVFLKNALTLARPGVGRLLLSTQSGRVWETEKRVGHQRHFSRNEMKNLLGEAGWKPLKIWNAGFPFHDLSKWAANQNPNKAMQQYGKDQYGFTQNMVCLLLRGLFKLNSNRHGSQLFSMAMNPNP